ncbi:MAG: DUF5522 domain-containing protein [Bdellovibrionota bacterium]
MKHNNLDELVVLLHEQACEKGEDFYTDPKTGYLVATRDRLSRLGKCCGSGCRHCPYRNGPINKFD